VSGLPIARKDDASLSTRKAAAELGIRSSELHRARVSATLSDR